MIAERRLRGFATLTPERRREIAREGGRAAHAKGVAHQWTPDEAVIAGRKGGLKGGGRFGGRPRK
jgi:general stress protein YciG